MDDIMLALMVYSAVLNTAILLIVLIRGNNG